MAVILLVYLLGTLGPRGVTEGKGVGPSKHFLGVQRRYRKVDGERIDPSR